jgi:hypothetical protein
MYKMTNEPQIVKGNRKAFYIAFMVVVCLLVGYFLRNASSGSTSGTSSISPSKKISQPRRSPGQLRALALARTTLPAATNKVSPFVSLLGPKATDYMGSMATLRQLPANLSSNQVETLRILVSIPYSPSNMLSALEFNGIKNVAADILLQQPTFPAEFLADLVIQHADPAQDEVWRDYCLQMLTTGYLNLGKRLRDTDLSAVALAEVDVPAARELALNTLMTATTAGGPTWPGTALLGLNTILASEPSAFPREELDKRIVAALSDASSSEAALITATRLAGMSRLESARPTLESLSKSSSSELVRTAAAKSLSELLPNPSS